MRRIEKKTPEWLLCIFCLALVVLLTPANAFAADGPEERTSSLTVESRCDGRALAGVSFFICKAADIEADGRFTPTADFAAYPVNLNHGFSSDRRALAQTLAGYAQRDGLSPAAQKVSDQNGRTLFDGLTDGLYLVVGHRYTDGDFTYVPEPFLVSLPAADASGEPVYDIRVTGKGEGFTGTPEPVSVKALKVWKDEGARSERPESIEIQLLCDGDIYETVELSAENGWRYLWTGLDASCTWIVVEKTVPKGYTVLCAKEGITFVLTNTYSPKLKQIDVKKEWNDGGHENKRPESIEVQLLCNESVYASVTLSAENGWRYSWAGLDAELMWNVREKSVPAGYEASVARSEGSFVITNTYKPKDPTLPQTGQLRWPIPVLICAGAVSYFAGFALKKRRNDEEKNGE